MGLIMHLIRTEEILLDRDNLSIMPVSRVRELY